MTFPEEEQVLLWLLKILISDGKKRGYYAILAIIGIITHILSLREYLHLKFNPPKNS